MSESNLWTNDVEIRFFRQSLEGFAPPEQLFYKLRDGYYAYVPRNGDGEGQTLQSRNSLIGRFTETWCKGLLSPIANEFGLYAVNGVICEELCLSRQSNADVAFCTTDDIEQEPENIKAIFEVKMSIVSNYIYDKEKDEIKFIGDYKSHKGNPSLLRSDSMLKAIGKSINIRVSGYSASKIPIIVFGNSPINESYVSKVDFLKKAGVIQGFLSLNPNPTESSHIENTPQNGFVTIDNEKQLFTIIKELVESDLNYFSSMKSKKELGNIITVAAKEKTDIEKAEKFLSLLQE